MQDKGDIHLSGVPAGTKYTACPMCNGRGKSGIVARPCYFCRGKGILPMNDPGGGWLRK